MESDQFDARSIASDREQIRVLGARNDGFDGG